MEPISHALCFIFRSIFFSILLSLSIRQNRVAIICAISIIVICPFDFINQFIKCIINFHWHFKICSYEKPRILCLEKSGKFWTMSQSFVVWSIMISQCRIGLGINPDYLCFLLVYFTSSYCLLVWNFSVLEKLSLIVQLNLWFHVMWVNNIC